LPELISDKAGKIAKLGLSKELSDDLAKTGKADLLISFVEEFTNLKASSIAEIMLSMPKIMRRKYTIDINPSDDDYKTLFTAMNQGKVSKDSLEDIFKEQKPMKDVLGKYQLMSDADVEKEIKKIVSENKELPFNALIGKVMGALRGKADSKKVVEMLNALK
jgi:Glu-tRNA(Gln) amidotransferase subunit E-like FAD-binding protein